MSFELTASSRRLFRIPRTEGPRLANFAPPLAAGGLEFTGLPSSLVAGSVPDVPAKE